MVIAIAVTLFACEGNYKKVRELNLQDNLPVMETFGGRSVYTDSGRVVSIMNTAHFKDFSNFDFTYQEFPQGVEVHFFEDGEESIITSEYARRYPETGIVDLRKNVVLTTADGNVLEAQQLYWDQENKWVFTDEPYRITFNDGSYNDGARFDANEDFTVFLSRNNDGIQIVDQNQTEEQNEQ